MRINPISRLQSWLSSWNDRRRDSRQKNKVIPKASEPSYQLERYDAVLVDDDPLVHDSWEYAAARYHKNLRCFLTYEDFVSYLPRLSKKNTIYLDFSLNDGHRGDQCAKKLSQLGFTEIYLATGYEPDHFPVMPWIKGIRSKQAPWPE